MKPLQFVTWNCLSCYPQYFDEVKAIEKGATSTALQANRIYNIKRYKNIISLLMPYIEHIRERKLTAILLQEVDFELLQMLNDTVRQSFRDVNVHFRKPYMTYPHNQPPPHQFAYFLVTLHHQHNHSRSCSLNTRLDRCLVTSLKTCTVYNVHIPWVAPEHPPYKHQRTEQTVRALSLAMCNHKTSVLLGDLNMSCDFNVGLYNKYFPQQLYNTHTFGESYKLSPENVRQRKTFKLLEHTPDDACIVHGCYSLSTRVESLSKKQMPIDHTGWFIKQAKSTYPSDHALARVDCIPVSNKHSRRSHTNRNKHRHYNMYQVSKQKSRRKRH